MIDAEVENQSALNRLRAALPDSNAYITAVNLDGSRGSGINVGIFEQIAASELPHLREGKPTDTKTVARRPGQHCKSKAWSPERPASLAGFGSAMLPPARIVILAALLGFIVIELSLVLFVLVLRHLGLQNEGSRRCRATTLTFEGEEGRAHWRTWHEMPCGNKTTALCTRCTLASQPRASAVSSGPVLAFPVVRSHVAPALGHPFNSRASAMQRSRSAIVLEVITAAAMVALVLYVLFPPN